MNKLKKWIHDALTEPGNDVVCPVRLMAVGGFIYAGCTHAWTIYMQHAAFDLQSFGMGYGAMIAMIGVSLGLKSDTKPDVSSVVQP